MGGSSATGGWLEPRRLHDLTPGRDLVTGAAVPADRPLLFSMSWEDLAVATTVVAHES